MHMDFRKAIARPNGECSYEFIIHNDTCSGIKLSTVINIMLNIETEDPWSVLFYGQQYQEATNEVSAPKIQQT